MTDQKFVDGLYEAVVRLRIQVKPISCHKLSDLRRKNQQRVMNKREESERLSLHDQLHKWCTVFLSAVELAKLRVADFLKFIL